MSNLPAGWAEAPLGDVCAVVSGSTPKSTEVAYWNGDIPWITPDDLSRHKEKYIGIGRRSISRAGLESCSTQMVPAGTVLYTSRAPIGYVAIAERSVCTNQGFKSLVPPPEIASDYLYWYMHYATAEVRTRASGTTFAEISGKAIKAVPLRLAPAAEQERIVAAIEEQFSRLDAAMAALERVRQNLKRMRAAVLGAATSGTLVPPDASEPSLAEHLQGSEQGGPLYESQPGNWVTTRISAIASVTSGATPSRGQKDYWQDGTIPWVTSTLVNRGTITHTKEFVTELALRETSVKLMPAGTLLVAMYGEGQTRGRCSELLIEATTNQACAGIVLQEPWSFVRPYLRLALTASYEANRRLSAGGVQPNLSVGIIKGLPIALPPRNEQRRILAETDRQLSIIDQLEMALGSLSVRSSQARSSILATAFSGKLVPQDSGDEPASVLLERIAADRVSSKGHKPAKARSQRRKKAIA